MHADPHDGSTRPAAEVADEPRRLADKRLRVMRHELRKRLAEHFFYDFWR